MYKKKTYKKKRKKKKEEEEKMGFEKGIIGKFDIFFCFQFSLTL